MDDLEPVAIVSMAGPMPMPGAPPSSVQYPSDIVTFMRPELAAKMPQYELVRDCIDGEQAVKSRLTKYLPMPNPTDQSPENKARYTAYVTRAVFYNATGRTQKGMVGQIFSRDPAIKLPTGLEDTVHENCDGSGITLEQCAKRSCNDAAAYGRGGLLCDYPTNGATAISRLDIQTKGYQPYITHYKPWHIRNWQIAIINGKRLYTLIVLQEPIQVPAGSFGLIETSQFRVLRLGTDSLYEVEVWKEREPGGGDYQMDNVYYPTDQTGKRWEFIPFTFIGSEQNNDEIDTSPMYDLATVNIAHFRNSADFEESCFIVGQPTLSVSGLDQEWYENVLDKTLQMGSRGGIPLPTGAKAEILQVTANTMAEKAMIEKEKLMVQLGARVAEAPTVQKTATQLAFDESSETSILSAIASNVSAAYTLALQWAARFTGDSDVDIEFELNKEFDLARMTPDDRRQTIAEWQTNAISFTEMRMRLRRGGVAILDDDEAQAEIVEYLASMPLPYDIETGIAGPGAPAPGGSGTGNPTDPANNPAPKPPTSPKGVQKPNAPATP